MAILGIDIGTSYAVMASIGRGTVTVVRNDISERLTPALVGFSPRERLLGDVALSQLRSNYKNTCRNMKMLMGRTIGDDPSLREESDLSYCPLGEAEHGLVGYEVTSRGESHVLSATAIMGTYLNGLKDIAERSLGQTVTDVVIGVPGWYTDRHRRAMLDAVKIAGLHCLRLMNEHTAVCLDYGIYRAREFHATEPFRVMFVSMGYANSFVCIAEFVTNELRILHVESDNGLGGRQMDHVLLRYFASDFSRKIGFDILSSPKARVKLEDPSIRAKKVLSANNEASVNIECLYEDNDLNVLVSREEFNELCLPMRQRFCELLKKAMAKNDKPINSIELIGGGTRVPWVQDAILEVTTAIMENALPLSRTLSADETVSKGCALQAAMLCPKFKVREFNIIDCTTHGINVSYSTSGASEISGMDVDGELDLSSGFKTQLLFPEGSTFPQRKWITFDTPTNLPMVLSYAGRDNLPADVPDIIAKYWIRGDAPTVSLSSTALSRKMKVKVILDINGIVTVDGAHIVEEEEVEQLVKEKRLKAQPATSPSKPSTEGETATSGDAGEETAGMTSPQTPAPTEEYETVEVRRKKKVTERKELPIECAPRVGWISAATHKSMMERELSMSHDDRQFREHQDRMNDLESYLYTMRDKVNGELQGYFSPGDSVVFKKLLEDGENWLYDEADHAQKSVVISKLDELKAYGEKASRLKRDREELPELSSQCLNELRTLRLMLTSPDEQYAHIDAAKKKTFIEECDGVEQWLNTQLQAIAATALYDQPSTSPTDIINKMKDLSDRTRTLLATPPPKPPTPSTKGEPVTPTTPTTEPGTSPKAAARTEAEA